MVSRNGGWNMTDLRGSLLPLLLKREEGWDFFLMLERSNWLIFQDAYPQLLLYVHSKVNRSPLFHLLPLFGVSVFMKAAWSVFWTSTDLKLLAYALITNEQQYIEERVVRHPYFQQRVLDHFFFRTQSALHFNQICFPYPDKKTGTIRLAGTIVRRFQNVAERIRVGKKLYAILFESGELSRQIKQWALQTAHTGSRSDYWGKWFTTDPDKAEGAARTTAEALYVPRLKGEKLHKKAAPLFSPMLKDVWPDIDHWPAEPGDWFGRETDCRLGATEQAAPYDVTEEYVWSMNRLELAVLIKQLLLRFGTHPLHTKTTE
jgi:hypothetical protein